MATLAPLELPVALVTRPEAAFFHERAVQVIRERVANFPATQENLFILRIEHPALEAFKIPVAWLTQ
jgi:hypothetical protein